MRKIAYLAAIAALTAIPSSSWCQGSQSQSQSSSAPPASAKSQSAPQTQPTSDASATAPAQDDSLAAAARKAKAQKNQSAAKPAKVFTNDDMPSSGISTVGVTNSGSSDSASASNDGKGETYWRERFAKLNKKLEQDQAELDIMQRELGQLNLQNYSDPVQAMQQGYSRGDINKKTGDIDAKQKQIDADKQAIDDAQDDLRKSGGDPGWAR